MSEQTILVCDECGRPAAETVTIRVGRGNFVKDLCQTHVSALVARARKPRRGRRRAVVAQGTAAPKRRGRPPKTASATGKRRGRPPKATTRKSRGRPRKRSSAS